MLALVASGRAEEQPSAESYFAAARRAERSGDVLRAWVLYNRAASLQPANRQFIAARQAMQVRTALAEQPPGPAASTLNAIDLVALGDLSPTEVQEARAALEPPHLKGLPGRRNFDVRGDARVVIEQVAAAFGISAVFGADYQSPPAFTFRMDNIEWQDALRALETVTNSFFVPVNEKLILVERDTPQRRQDTTPAMSIAIPIPERLTVQEAQEIITTVQQTMEIRRVSVDPGRHLVILRDQASKVKAAQILFHELSRPRAQVEVEVEFLAVSKNSSLHYGLTTPTSMPLVNFGKFLGNTVGSTAGFTQFLVFGGGTTLFGLGVANARLLGDVSKSTASSVLASQLVTADGQPATMHVGDRYPIITAGYYGGTSGSGQSFSPPPTVNFQDLGLTLKVTPAVHGGGEVSLEIEAEYNVLGADTGNQIPIISRRKYNGKVRLISGEAAVIAGMVKNSVSESSSGLLGVDHIPWIGKFLRGNTIDKEDTEILLVLTPRLTNQPAWETPSPAVWVGTESHPLTLY